MPATYIGRRTAVNHVRNASVFSTIIVNRSLAFTMDDPLLWGREPVAGTSSNHRNLLKKVWGKMLFESVRQTDTKLMEAK